MSDETASTEAPLSSTTPSTTDTQAEQRTVPLEAVQEERRKRQAAEAELATLREANAERQRQEQEQRGEFQRLYEEAKARLDALEPEAATLREQVEATKAARKAALDEAVAALPEDLQALIPEGLTDDQREAQVKRLQGLATSRAGETARVPHGGRTSGGGGPAKPLSPEARRWWEGSQQFNPATTDETIQKLYNTVGPGKGAGT